MKCLDLLFLRVLGDIASDLSHHASQVYLSTRRGVFIIKRLTPGTTKPFDHQLTRAESFVNKYFHRSLMRDWVNDEYDFVCLGLQPTGIPLVHHFLVINDDLPNKIITGQVIVKGELKELRETSFVFDGEDVVEDIDAVVFCTGFQLEFPFASDIITVEDEKYARYKTIIPFYILYILYYILYVIYIIYCMLCIFYKIIKK